MKRVVRTPFVVASLAVLVCVTTIGCGGGGYDTPEAAFDAMKAAAEKKDWKGFCACMTPDSQDAMAGGMVMAGTMMKVFGAFAAMAGGEEAEKVKAGLKKLDEVFEKHGIDEETMEKMQEKTKGEKPEDPKEILSVLKELAAPVKDKPAFIGDMIGVMEEMDPDETDMTFANATLKDVKIDGDTATATMVKTVKGKEETEPINFKKIGGGWLVDIPAGEFTFGGSAAGE